MSEWKRTDDGSVPGKATMEKATTYRMERGQAGIFQNRAIHSIAYSAGSRFIRVTGTNLENIARGRYNSEAGKMVIEKRPTFAARPERQFLLNRKRRGTPPPVFCVPGLGNRLTKR